MCAKGYESEENYTYLENNNQKALIKPQTYEKSKTKKFKNDISKRENMQYNQEDDYYICAVGKKLLPKGFTTRKSKSNFKSIVNIYECESCLGCKYKNKCTKAKNNRQLQLKVHNKTIYENYTRRHLTFFLSCKKQN